MRHAQHHVILCLQKEEFFVPQAAFLSAWPSLAEFPCISGPRPGVPATLTR